MKQHNVSSFAERRTHFSSADQAGKLTVFNVGGIKVRLIAAIHYNRRKPYIRAVLTHVEYAPVLASTPLARPPVVSRRSMPFNRLVFLC